MITSAPSGKKRLSWQQEQASASVTVAIREERQPGGWRERCHYKLSDLEEVWGGGARGRKRLNIQAITQPVEITSLCLRTSEIWALKLVLGEGIYSAYRLKFCKTRWNNIRLKNTITLKTFKPKLLLLTNWNMETKFTWPKFNLRHFLWRYSFLIVCLHILLH